MTRHGAKSAALATMLLAWIAFALLPAGAAEPGVHGSIDDGGRALTDRLHAVVGQELRGKGGRVGEIAERRPEPSDPGIKRRRVHATPRVVPRHRR